MRLLTISFLVFFSSAMFAQNFEWTAQNSGVTTSLRDVFFTDNQNGWAVGDNGVIVNTTDAGQNWTSQTSGTTERLRAVFFVDASIGFIAGGVNTKTILRTTDGGSNWVDITPETIIDNQQVLDIAFADANTGWAIVYDSIYRTTDGGDTWTTEPYSINNPFGLDHKAIAVTSDTTAYIAGTRQRTTGSAYADVFNKNPYEGPAYFYGSAVNQFETDDKLRCIAFSNYTTGFAGGDNGIIYKFEQVDPFNMAGPWDKNFELSSPNVGGINSISFPSESIGMFNTSIDISGTSYALIYHTADTGYTWSASPDTIPGFLQATVHAADTANAWVVGALGKIYKGVRKPTGIHQRSLNIDVSIYPNPATDKVNVEINSESNEPISYTLLDVTGRIIEQGQWSLNSSNSRFTLSLSDAIKGMYLLKLSTDKGQSTFRVLKK